MSQIIYNINHSTSRALLKGLLLAAALFIQGCSGASDDSTEVTLSPLPPVESDVPPNIVVIFTDDHGYADLGVQNVVTDVVTPNIDNLALSGVRFTNGYVTAPQCTPSRAGLLTGQYQQRFGLDENAYTPMSLSVKTLAERFQEAGYKTGMAGKWHLEVNNGSKYWAAENYPGLQPFKSDDVPLDVRRQYFPDNRGFDDTFMGYNVWYWQNFTKTGESIEAQYVKDTEYRIDLVNKAAVQFIHRHSDEPFFLYVAPYGPHVPLAAIDKDLGVFSEDMAVRRRYGLAMLHAIDRGVGDIVSALEQYQLMDNTLIIFASDNGAPIDETMPDLPISELGVWDGSLNTPLAGEKGMLTEGGIKVPFIASLRGHIEKGMEVTSPVSTLDLGFTMAKLAEIDTSELDGMDLFPLLEGDAKAKAAFDSRDLYWRFYYQRAVRKGKYKYLQAGINREYLFDLEADPNEKINIISDNLAIAEELKTLYWQWDDKMYRQDIPIELNRPFGNRYDFYLGN